MRTTTVPASAAAIVGLADTDYRTLALQPNGETGSPAVDVLERAIADAGLTNDDVDAVGIAGYPVGCLGHDDLAPVLGARPYQKLPAGSIAAAVTAIATGEASTVALVYATSQRSVGVQYGGASGTRAYQSYYYYHPWGFSSQGAHWALAFQRHQLCYGSTEKQLGAVAVELSRYASLNSRAVRPTPLTLDDYLESRYICRPLRRPDYCMVNDGAVALILTAPDRARSLPHLPVIVSGSASTEEAVDAAQIRSLVMDAQYPAIKSATEAALLAAGGLSTQTIDHFQVYDAFSVNLPFALEGAGFCPRGEGFSYIQDGRIGLAGDLPSNTSGGMLFESYMHGWNHTVEAVRQLRHESGERQVEGAAHSLYVLFTSCFAESVVFSRADA